VIGFLGFSRAREERRRAAVTLRTKHYFPSAKRYLRLDDYFTSKKLFFFNIKHKTPEKYAMKLLRHTFFVGYRLKVFMTWQQF